MTETVALLAIAQAPALVVAAGITAAATLSAAVLAAYYGRKNHRRLNGEGLARDFADLKSGQTGIEQRVGGVEVRIGGLERQGARTEARVDNLYSAVTTNLRAIATEYERGS